MMLHRGESSPMFAIVLAWEAFKDWLSGGTGLTHHDLHLLLGVLLTIGFGWLLRLPLGAWRPLLIVFALEMLNETSDFTRYYISDWPWTPRETMIDIALTLIPPLILVLAARWQSADYRRFCHRTPPTADLAQR